jgi:hypothetical protein
MAQTSVIVGGVLVMLGAVGYVITDMVSLTALIPAAFGLVIILLGIMAYRPSRTKLAMHIAMVVALVGIVGSAGGLVDVVRGAFGPAAIARAIMAVVLALYLALGVRSFIAARRR